MNSNLKIKTKLSKKVSKIENKSISLNARIHDPEGLQMSLDFICS
jgi:hypothetical protein